MSKNTERTGTVERVAEGEHDGAIATGIRRRASPGTVLVVDDDPLVLAMTRRSLERFGYTVVTASSGEQGLDLFRHDPLSIDLVLMDFSLPGMSGPQACVQLQRLRHDVRIIIASGYHVEDACPREISANVVGYAHKPYRPAELAAKISEVLRSVDEGAGDLGRDDR